MARPYIQPIIIAEYDENGKAIEKKPRRIKLHKGPMEQEINAHTYKYVEAGQIPTPQQQNAISSDTDEVLDGSVISRLMDYRDSQLRLLIKGAMKKVEILEVDNLQYLAPIYVYDLELSLEFNDAGLKALANLMHKYIVWGVLFDWYSQLGLAEANVYGSQLADIEAAIKSDIYPAGYAKRPMQPFGPAHKM